MQLLKIKDLSGFLMLISVLSFLGIVCALVGVRRNEMADFIFYTSLSMLTIQACLLVMKKNNYSISLGYMNFLFFLISIGLLGS